MNRLLNWFTLIIKKQKGLKRWHRVVTVLAAMITFATTYALILPAITVEKNSTEDVGGMYLEKTAKRDDLLEDNALEPVGVSIAADMDNAVSFAYSDDDMTATAIFSTDEIIPEGAELVVNNVTSDSEEYADLSGRAADLLDKEFIYDVTSCSFYDFALVCDNVDVTPKTGMVDIQIIFRNNTNQHVNDVVYVGRFARPSEDADGFAAMAVSTVEAEAEADDTVSMNGTAVNDNSAGESGNPLVGEDELVSLNIDESSVIELSDGIITSLSLKGSDLSRSDSLVGIIAGYVDEEIKAAAAETDAEIPEYDESQDEDEQRSSGEDASANADNNVSTSPEEDSSGTSAEDERKEITDALQMKTLKASGKDYTVTLTYDESSKIPEGASLTVSEISKDSKEYQTYLEETKKAMGLKEEETLPGLAARFFDIKIMVGGKEFNPESGVSVEITYAEPLAEHSETEVNAVHFADEKAEAEMIEANTAEVQDDGKATVEFTAESFSVYGVIYTVDFHYEVNGKMYEFSIPGGGFASFYKIVEVLGISNLGTQSGSGDENVAENSEIEAGNGENTDGNDVYNVVEEASVEETGANSNAYEESINLNNVEVSEAAKKFVADVASVEFSSPELVWVGKVDEATTVGALKEANGLEVQYSAELTEEQIAEINSNTVETGDWALISVLPFTSEETLTVTMKNGDQWTVKVTDAQISTHVITAKGEDYIITVTYGPEAEIPDKAQLRAEEIVEKSEEYAVYLERALEAIGKTGGDIIIAEEDDESGDDITFARFFDISILSEGKKIEPASPVEVEIRYLGNHDSFADGLMEVVHFANDGTEVISAATLFEEDAATVSFEQDSFSVTGTVVTDVPALQNGEYFIIYQDGSRTYALTNSGGKVEVTYNSSQNTVKYDGEESITWNVENYNSYWSKHYRFQSKSNSQYYIGLDPNSNNILRQWYGVTVLDPVSSGKYTMKGDSYSNGAGKYLGWTDNNFAAVNSNPASVMVVKVEPIDEIDTSNIRVDERVHYIITDHYLGDDNTADTVIRANGYLTSGQSIPFSSNPTSTQEYAGVTVTAGHDAVSIGSNGNVTVRHNSDIHLVHVDYYYKRIRPTTEVTLFNENDKYDTKTIDGEKYYELKEERVHTDKTASVVEGGDGRSFNLKLEAWNVDWNIATIGMVLDASGSMAWDGAPGHYMQVNSDNKYQTYKFLSQTEVNKILCTDYSDYSVSGYGNYTYFVYEPGKNVNEYAPLGYYGGADHSGNYLTMDGTSGTRFATQVSIPQGRAGWYYVNTGNANAFNAIGGSKEYNGINQNDSKIQNQTFTIHTSNGDKYVTFYRDRVNNNSVYHDDIKEWFVDNDTTGMYRKTSTYGATQGTPAQFYVDDDGYLHCFYYHSDTVFESYVYAKQDTEPIKTEMLQDAIGSFTSVLDSIAPDSAIGMTRFSRSNTTNTNGFNDNQLTLLNWTTDSATIISSLNMAYGGEYKANSSKTDGGYGNAGNLTVYDYGLTSNTSTQSGLTSFNTYLATNNNGALTKWAQDNAKPVATPTGTAYEYDKYVIVFTDGKDTDRNNSHSADAQNAADTLKGKGYSVITVLLAPDSAFNNGNLNQEFSDAKSFLDTLNGPRNGGTGLDWTEETFIATAADKSALTAVFLDIANKIAKTMTGMTVRDYIDPRFQLVDENDNPITLGYHPELGYTVGYDADRDMYYAEWTGQDIPTNNVVDNTVVGDNGEPVDVALWSKTIRVRAKDDFLGGNEILSNGNVEDLNKVYPDGHPEDTNVKTSRTFPRTTVDPQVLELELGSAEDTVYLGETIDADMHDSLESAIGATVDSSWYYEYLDRYGTVTNTDYITLLQQGEKVEIPYYYMPDDTTKAIFDAAVADPDNLDAYMKDRIGTLTYEWVPCDAEGNEITLTDPYNHLTTNTDDIHYRLKIKYTPYTESERDTQVDAMIDEDSYDRDVREPVGTLQEEIESDKDQGIATVHVVSGKLQVKKKIKTADIQDYFANNPDKTSVTFNFTLSREYNSSSETYPDLTTDYKVGYTSAIDGTYTYPAAITATIQRTDVENLNPDNQEYIAVASAIIEKLPIGTYTLTENTDDAFKLVNYTDATGEVFASESAYLSKVTGGTESATIYIGIVHDGVPATATVKSGSPYLNAQRAAVTVLNKVNPQAMLYKADMTNTSLPVNNAVFNFYKEVEEGTAGAVDDVIPDKYVILLSSVTSGSYIQTTGEDTGEALAGFASLGGVDTDNTYYLVESSVPAGYISPEWAFIKITFFNDNVRWTAYKEDGTTVFGTPGSAAKETVDGKNCYKVTVLNNPGVELPSTGGPGTNLIYLLGLLLTSFAGTGILMKRRRRKEA